jgi:predicted chitinase
VQRALAEFYLLNPHDDVDGLIGSRTRDAWKFFQEATGQTVSDTIDDRSAGVLIKTLDNPGDLIGQAKVALQPDFEFRRKQSAANRATSAPAIIQAAHDRQSTKAQIAYILATAEHESDSFNTLEEYSKGNQYEGRPDLGNTHPGDGVCFKGRGYVQLTGRLNYTRYTEITGLELVKLPIILMNRPALSVFVIVDGMMRGIYTGRRLDEFVNNGKQDFFNARQVVNGHDRADKIAAQADDWLKNLP